MSAVRFEKRETYSKSPQLCNCPKERWVYVGAEETVDIFKCTDCGSTIRVRGRDFDEAGMRRSRA